MDRNATARGMNGWSRQEELEQGRPHHKPNDKENQKGDDKDEKEHLGDPGSRSRDPGEAEQSGDDRNNQEK
jgi:hypothetical protein